MYSENVLTKGQVISRPEWPCKNAQWRPEAFLQTVGPPAWAVESCCLDGRVGLAKQQGKRVAHRLSKWPTDMEIDGTLVEEPKSGFFSQLRQNSQNLKTQPNFSPKLKIFSQNSDFRQQSRQKYSFLMSSAQIFTLYNRILA